MCIDGLYTFLLFLMAGWLVNEEDCPLQLNIWLNFFTI